ncbi:MAG: hypothetical protein QT03_C0001G0004 [archaeon GW2011_AR10]|uniref:UPF0175 family protein n=1 Tax=Candidatus Iainarchaeum sp. TaxID=3101447 RepID=A0A7J4IUS5_9ARCH|nr:MAG: hypothetical protein QT03_C0001G0004 [archaeon GW2011_AR10]HIH07975.1 UPF0175 family protein [Candidatus Diapherotrites archaeon]
MVFMQEAVVSTRISRKETEEIESLARELDLDRSALLKKMIRMSLEELKTEHAFKLYKEGKVSFGKAAEIAGKNLWEMIDLTKKYDAYLNYSEEQFMEDLENLKEFK